MKSSWQHLINGIFHDPNKGRNIRKELWKLEQLAAYHNNTDISVVKVLLSDDAPQFKKITEEQLFAGSMMRENYKN